MNNRICSWEQLTRIGKSRLITFTIVVPIIGYMIIFNERLIQFLELSQEIFPQSIAIINKPSENLTSRLFYFYFGFSFLGIGSIAYQLLCPSIIKKYESFREYVGNEIDLMTQKKIQNINEYLVCNLEKKYCEELEKIDFELQNHNLESKFEEHQQRQSLITDFMFIHWQHENFSIYIARIFVFVFYIMGFLVLAIPTLETFWFVTVAFIK